ncbi:MAG TPA: flagellar hook-associated protein FlgL [Clostridia bacterium]|nr:flagellar hook-associated protein FlgL [Clostridia bacterium]
MGTRITNNITTRNYLKGMRSNLSNLSGSNEKLTTQRSFSKASEDVTGAARALRVRKLLSDNERNISNTESLTSKLDTAESNLRSLSTVYQRMNDLVVHGMNDSMSDQDRQILSNEVSNLRDQALSIANSKYGDQYLFSSAGNATGSAPFTVGTDNLLYYNGNSTAIDKMVTDANGNAATDNGNGTTTEIDYNGTNYLDIGLGLSVSGSGASVQIDTRTAVQSSLSGLDVFGYGTDSNGVPNNFYSLFNNISEHLSTGDTASLQSDLSTLSASHDNMLIALADIGNNVSFIENVSTQLESDRVSLQELQNSVEGVDLAEEIMYNKEFEMAWTVTLQLGSNILPKSIFDFL